MGKRPALDHYLDFRNSERARASVPPGAVVVFLIARWVTASAPTSRRAAFYQYVAAMDRDLYAFPTRRSTGCFRSNPDDRAGCAANRIFSANAAGTGQAKRGARARARSRR